MRTVVEPRRCHRKRPLERHQHDERPHRKEADEDEVLHAELAPCLQERADLANADQSDLESVPSNVVPLLHAALSYTVLIVVHTKLPLLPLAYK